MIKKLKWKTLMTQISAKTEVEKFATDVEAIDTELNTGLNYSTKSLKSLLGCVTEDILTSADTGIWKDLLIFVSSYKENDKRFIYLLCSKLREYLDFYKKILTDEGIQRSMVYAKTYTNNGSASSTERGLDSTTPQNSNLYDPQNPESDSLFDQAIANYASSIDKSKASSTSQSYGGSTTNVSGVTWDEAKKNIQLLFFNELKDYIMSIPERIYSYYSIDTIPAPELFKLTLEHIKAVEEMFVTYE